MNPENASSPDDKILARRAKHIFRIDADRQFNHYTLGGTFLAEGKRFDDTENTRLLNGFVRVDLRAEYAFAQNWRLQARLENLFNEHYETAAFLISLAEMFSLHFAIKRKMTSDCLPSL